VRWRHSTRKLAPYRTPRWQRFGACFVLAALAFSCDSDGDGGGVSPPGPTVAPGPSVDQGCTESFPRRLTVTTDNQAEIPYLDQVPACTAPGQAETLLVNESDAVWLITTTTAGATYDPVSSSLRARSFLAIANQYATAILSPESSVLVHADPASVEWTLHPGLSAMWLGHDWLADTVERVSQAQLTSMLSGNSTRRRALIECSLTAYQVAGETGSGLQGRDPAEQLLFGMGVLAGVTHCESLWRQADEEATRVFGRTATWGDDVARLAEDARLLSEGDDLLRSVLRFRRISVLIT
jgi:hypothetical protein